MDQAAGQTTRLDLAFLVTSQRSGQLPSLLPIAALRKCECTSTEAGEWTTMFEQKLSWLKAWLTGSVAN